MVAGLVDRIQPTVFPVITGQTGDDLIFLGAAVYFAYGLWRPVWGNAKGQLFGFLAYDLVLIMPFAKLWFSSPSLSLLVYLAVIAGSALLAIWYLALSPRYRLWTSE